MPHISEVMNLVIFTEIRKQQDALPCFIPSWKTILSIPNMRILWMEIPYSTETRRILSKPKDLNWNFSTLSWTISGSTAIFPLQTQKAKQGILLTVLRTGWQISDCCTNLRRIMLFPCNTGMWEKSTGHRMTAERISKHATPWI